MPTPFSPLHFRSMSFPVFFISVLSIPIFSVQSVPAPRGFLLNCGALEEVELGSQTWVPDEGFIDVGNRSSLTSPDLFPTLSTLRYFPDPSARKYCFVIPVVKGGKYLVRTTYYYGDFDGGKVPPVFDQIVEGTKWGTVNTTSDFANGMSSYYEIIVAALGKTISVCLARNNQTLSSPFISSLEVNFLENSIYNSTDFVKYALITVSRHSFGTDRDLISFPDDQYNRFWQSFMDENPVVVSKSNVTSTNLWNIPPSLAFETALTTSRGKVLEIQWPPVSLPSTNYYISLYFQDSRTPSPYSWRVFDVYINGEKFYSGLNVTTDGMMVYSTEWPLSGLTKISMSPAPWVPVGPIVSAGEILQILPLGGKTLANDAAAMYDLARSLHDPPPDWKGDPCMPLNNSWTGVACTEEDFARVLRLDLTGSGLSGSLSPSVGNLTAITSLLLGANRLSGSIPEMNQLTMLEFLDLENNQFEGRIPASLSQLPKLREISLQNNRLEGGVPEGLQKKKGTKLNV